MTNQMNKWIKRALRQLRDSYGNCCLKCGGETKLQFAHTHPTDVKGWGRGRKERYYDVLKHPEAYVLLCKDCHTEYDTDQFEIIEQKTLHV